MPRSEVIGDARDLNGCKVYGRRSIDHTKLTFKYQGRHFRLTDVHGRVVNQILA